MLLPGSIIFVFAFASARGWQPMRDPLFSWFGISLNIQNYKFESCCPMRVDLHLFISKEEYCYYFLLPMSQSTQDTITKCHRQVNNRNLFLTVMEAKIKVLAGTFRSEASSHGFISMQTAAISLCAHMTSSLRKHGVRRWRATCSLVCLIGALIPS